MTLRFCHCHIVMPPGAEVGPPKVVLQGHSGIPDFSPGLQPRKVSEEIGGTQGEAGGTPSLADVAFLRIHAPSCLRLMCPLPPLRAVCENFRCPHVQCGMGTALVEVWSPDRCCPYKSCGKSLRGQPLPKAVIEGPFPSTKSLLQLVI